MREKIVKSIIVAITWLIGLGLPQMANAQIREITQEDVDLIKSYEGPWQLWQSHIGDYENVYNALEYYRKRYKNKRIDKLQAKYTKKYGATSSNYLSKYGIIAKGMSFAFIREYVSDFNQMNFDLMGGIANLKLVEYQPTVRDMMQFGNTVKSYGIKGAWAFLVLNGKVVSCRCLTGSDPNPFLTLDAFKSIIDKTPPSGNFSSTPTNNKKVFDVVEQMPSFPGGWGAMMSWLSQNLKYPDEAKENGAQGRVIVQFVVEKDGSITDVKVVKPVDPLLDKESIRLVSNMPKWEPGRHGGQAVNVKYTVPVTFKIE